MAKPLNSGSNSKKAEIGEAVKRLRANIAQNIETRSAEIQRDLLKLKELMMTVFSELSDARSAIERMRKQLDKHYKEFTSEGVSPYDLYQERHLSVVTLLGETVIAEPEDQWRSLQPLSEAAGDLALQVSYNLFDLEASIREREDLRKLLGGKNR